MASVQGIRRMAQAAMDKAAMSIVRAVLKKVTEGGKGQTIEVEAYGERYRIEMLSPYGRSYWAPSGSELAMQCASGDLSQGVATSLSHRDSRVKCQQEGDNILYHMEGHKVYLQKAGKVSIVSGAGGVHLGKLTGTRKASGVGDTVAPDASWATFATQVAAYINGLAPASVTPPGGTIGIISSGESSVNL